MIPHCLQGSQRCRLMGLLTVGRVQVLTLSQQGMTMSLSTSTRLAHVIVTRTVMEYTEARSVMLPLGIVHPLRIYWKHLHRCPSNCAELGDNPLLPQIPTTLSMQTYPPLVLQPPALLPLPKHLSAFNPRSDQSVTNKVQSLSDCGTTINHVCHDKVQLG